MRCCNNTEASFQETTENDLGTSGIPSGNFDDMKFDELNRLRHYLHTMLCSVDYELE